MNTQSTCNSKILKSNIALIISRSRHALLCAGAIFLLGCLSVLPAYAAWVQNGDNTVTDTVTGLMWDQCVYPVTGASCEIGTAFVGNWGAALSQASFANAVNHKGFSDWRVANRNELVSLVKIDRQAPAIDSTVFPANPIGNIWTSTIYSPAVANAWIVDFNDGGTGGAARTALHPVRLVRDGNNYHVFDVLAPFVSNVSVPIQGDTTATANGTSSILGTAYWIVVPQGAVAPTPAQVRAGVNYPSVNLAAAGNATVIAAATAQTFVITGLLPDTDYQLYFVATNTDGDLSLVEGPAPFRTRAASLLAIPALSLWSMVTLACLLSLVSLPYRRRTNYHRTI